MRIVLVLAVVIQIWVAIQSSGLTRALAELTAFLIVMALVLQHRSRKKRTHKKNVLTM